MKTQINSNSSSQLETLLENTNQDSSIYGLEYVVDELNDNTNSQRNEQNNCDWFGFSDLCI